MNSTVWYEQIDRGLIDFIQNTVKLSDSGGQLVPVPVTIRKPDEDFKRENYPMVTIYNLWTSKRDEIRYYPFKIPVEINKDTGKAFMERPAVPYSLNYQIDFWSVMQSEMNEMLRQWEFEVSRDFNLPVVDTGGTLRYAHALQTGENLSKTDRLSDGSRVFNTSITYRIWAELDEEDVSKLEELPIVLTREIHTKPY